MKKVIFGLLILGIWGLRAYAADLYVPSQYPTIQAGINAATTGDCVWVANGTYTGTSNKNLSWSGKHITVKSVNGPANCVIDCENNGRGFCLDGGQNGSDTISGFTIRNGNVDYGGGIYCSSSSPNIINCIITKNSAWRGGGIVCHFSFPSITNCVIGICT